jgi:hypothetical protein
VDTKQTQMETEVEWVHETGRHIAQGDRLDGALAATTARGLSSGLTSDSLRRPWGGRETAECSME